MIKKVFRFIMLMLNIIAAISLLLACLCSFVNPKTIWWIGFFGLGYMYLLAVNLCFVVFWTFSRKKIYVVISILTILTGWTFLGRNVQIFEKEIPEDKLSESFKILSFNVQGFEQMRNKESNDNIFDFIRTEDADIICLQEFVNFRWKIFDEKFINKQFENTPFSHFELPGKHFGIATYSKFPIISKDLVFSDNTTNACMCSDIIMGNDTIRVYNIHLKSVGFNNDERHLLDNFVKKEYDESDMQKIKSIFQNLRKSSLEREKQVNILTAHIEQSPYPVIICGDFNDPPTSFSYRKVCGNRNDAFIEAGAGRSTTYNIGRIASLRIDYIMYSDIFKAYSYESPRVQLSDHFPVMCRLVKK